MATPSMACRMAWSLCACVCVCVWRGGGGCDVPGFEQGRVGGA